MTHKHRQDAAKPASMPLTQPKVMPDLQSGGQFEAIQYLKAGRLAEAAVMFERLITENPENWQSIHLLGLIAYRQRDYPRAVELIQRCLEINPGLAEGYSDLGVVLKEMGELDDALAACEKAIALKPGFHPAHSNLGNIFKVMGRLEDAADCYVRAVELAPNFVDGYANLGATLAMMGHAEDALAACKCAVDLSPNHVEALIAYGHALRVSNKIDDAITVYRRAIELKPDYGPPHSDLGCLLQQRGRLDEALREHRLALELKPDSAEAHNNLGVTLKELGRYAEAIEAYRTAIALKPNYADAHSNMGVILDVQHRHREAVEAYRRAIELNPKLTIAYVNLAGSLWEQSQLRDAIAVYAKALAIDPNHAHALVDYYHLRRHACDWDGLAAIEQKILTSTYRKGERIPPFPMLNIPCGAEDHLLAARQWAKGLIRPISTPFTYGPPRSATGDGRLRIGYLSADFYGHATASLITEVIEHHDRTRFEIFGYCLSREEDSDIRRRLIAGFDRFVFLTQMSHEEAARRIHQDGIDILIDLKGYTMDARTEIITGRPAPIQVNYLGYPGTMGADFIDYVIADDFILPMDQQPFFDEKIVHLPGCYQPNDRQRPIAETTPSRAECGLPEKAFVFCCFNNNYKITPEVFAVWMRILQNTPGSVLWLLEGNTVVRENLLRHAIANGVDPARLIFARRAKLPEHLARHRNADLFLDTLPVNAHTTASDALWAGLPVLTCASVTFVSRVCGSLLKAVGLGELIAYSLDQYERMAIALAQDPARLGKLRQRLESSRGTAPLFDSERYTRGLEAAFEHMAELRVEDRQPHGFSVTEIRDDGAHVETVFDAGALSGYLLPEGTHAKPLPSLSARIAFDACPICSSPAVLRFKEADCSRHPGYTPALPPVIGWCRCTSCGHVFTEGYLAPNTADAVLTGALNGTAAPDLQARRAACARIVGRVARLKPDGDWLDVHFGVGALLMTAEEWGFRPIGLDPRQERVETLKALGYEAHCLSLDSFDAPDRFSVVSMAHVLPCMPYPRTAISAARTLLKPGGVLFCSMPNMATTAWRDLEDSGSNPYWSEIECYHHFTRERLYKLLKEHGLTPAEYAVGEAAPATMEVISVRA